MTVFDWSAIGLLLAGGVLAFSCGARPRLAGIFGAGFGVLALLAVLLPLAGAWQSGAGLMDRMGAWFRLPIGMIGIAAILHAVGYLRGHGDDRGGVFWSLFLGTLASMLCVTFAEGFLSFLVFWELMGIFSFALVAFEYRSRTVMRAAWIYLLAGQAGGLLLMLLISRMDAALTAGFFALGTIAFGLKAGLPFLHVWLPEAHPAAPAPVSALMSGAMIPLGFYGMFRFVFLGSPWLCGWTLLILGIAGALLGILFALAQSDLKRLLAYSSVENMGIISLGLGLGFLGTAAGNGKMAFFGFAGAFLHVLNHGFLKGTLFLAAGSVYKSVHSLDMDRMGGLIRRLPQTGYLFTAAALGICGLPPFCGFAGELLIYVAAFSGVIAGGTELAIGSFVAAVALAVTGGLACAALVKAVFAVFLGEPRSPAAAEAHPEERGMVAALWLLLLPALAMTLLAPVLVEGVLTPLFGGASEIAASAADILWKYGIVSGLFVVFCVGLLTLRKSLPRGGEARITGTWDCGYLEPTPRMEYTGSAFAQAIMEMYRGILGFRPERKRPEGVFPCEAQVEFRCRDFGEHWVWGPVFRFVGGLSEGIHRIQSGYLHLYILLMVLALLAMLAAGILLDPASAERFFKSFTGMEAIR